MTGSVARNRRLGHADVQTTLNIYGHLFPDRLDEVADVIPFDKSNTENLIKTAMTSLGSKM